MSDTDLNENLPSVVHPILATLAEVLKERGTDDMAGSIRIAAIRHLKPLWAAEAAEVCRRGRVVAAMQRMRQEVVDRIKAAQADADRLAAAEKEAEEAAAEASRVHGALFVSNGGKPNAKSKAADAAAAAAAKRVADIELEIGTAALDAVKHGATMLAEAGAELAEADEDLRTALHVLFTKRVEVLQTHAYTVSALVIRPMFTEMAATRAAAHLLIDTPLESDRAIRMVLRDGALVEPPGRRDVRAATDHLVATARRAAGVGETWRGRRTEEDRRYAAHPIGPPPQPAPWGGMKI